jgi:MFS family permease
MSDSSTMNGSAASPHDAAGERTPLLPKPADEPTDPAAAATVEDDEDALKPYNKGQVILLSCVRMIDPIAFFCIVPFVNQMIFDAGGIAEEDVGFYSGLIVRSPPPPNSITVTFLANQGTQESLFSVMQMFTMVPWGLASDRYGRKPVLVASLVGLTFTMGGFGFCRKVWQMMVLRCAAGLFSGAIV